MEQTANELIRLQDYVKNFANVYDAFPLEHDEIRLLGIASGAPSLPVTCFMKRQRLSEPLGDDLGGFGYRALSYTWGSPDFTESIRVCGVQTHNTKNLHAALKQLRLPHQFCYVWIDQICINQNDASEKSRQIRIMKDIYSSAAEVVVWLGPADRSTERALNFAYFFLDTVFQANKPDQMATDHHLKDGVGDLIRAEKCVMFRESKHPQMSRLRSRPFAGLRNWSTGSVGYSTTRRLTGREPSYWLPTRDHQDWKALREFLSCAWFSRVWVIQEAAMASKLTVFCGKHRLEWSFLVLLVDALYYHVPPFFFGADVEASGGLPANSVRDIQKIEQCIQHGGSLSMFELITRHQNLRATEPADKIIALEGLSAEDWPQIQTLSVQRLYIETAVRFLQQVDELPNMGPLNASNLLKSPDAFAGVPISPQGWLSSILRSAGISSQNLDLPSWVPDWSVSARPLSFYRLSHKPSHQRAGSYAMGTVRLQIEPDTAIATDEGQNVEHGQGSRKYELRLEGKILGTVKTCNSAHICIGLPLETQSQQEALGHWFVQAYELVSSFWSASASAGTDGRGSQESLFQHIISSLCGFVLDRSEYQFNHEVYAKAPWLKFSIKSAYKKNVPFEVPAEYYWELTPLILGRRFFQLHQGLFGIGPIAMQVGDRLAVIAGIEVPFILRPVGVEQYRLVGECAVASRAVMGGDAWVTRPPDHEAHEFGKLSVQAICLL